MSANRRLIFDALLLGIVGALSAQLFTFLLGLSQDLFLGRLAHYIPPGLPEEGGALKESIGPYGLWLLPVAVTVGGLISGLLVYTLAPEAEGHGTDSAVKAFHYTGGYIRYRVPFVKMIASAITIGSGGAAGREGPTALIAAGIGSIYASILNRSDEERRLLVLTGTAAGLSAIFRSPLGCAVFAVEVLYRDMELEARALGYTILAALVAYVINAWFVGWEPLFQVPANLDVSDYTHYAWFALLGLVSGLVAVILPEVFYRTRDLFHALPGPPHIKPAIGGLGVGIMALFVPHVLGGGYGWMQEAINGAMSARLLVTLLFAKMIAFALTVSSGGSGGIFAPCLFVGAMLGGFISTVFGLPPAPFVVIGIVAVFGAAARVPLATLLMVVEMTGGYQLLVPAATALTLSCGIQAILSRRLTYQTLYEGQVPTRADSPSHHAEHVRIALGILSQGRIPTGAEVGHVDLVEVIRSGVPVDLPDEKRLHIIDLHPAHPCVRGPNPAAVRDHLGEKTEVMAILRGGGVLLPEPSMKLEPTDRLLVVRKKTVGEE